MAALCGQPERIDPWTFRWVEPNERWIYGAWQLRFCPTACVPSYTGLGQCVAGPEKVIRNLAGGCTRFDFDHDGDVDLMDYAIVQLLSSTTIVFHRPL